MRLPIFENFDEQALVSFTGKLNVLLVKNREYQGAIFFLGGEIINAQYRQVDGFKALMSLCVLSSDSQKYSLVLEPEVVSSESRKIEIPLGALKRRVMENIDRYNESEKYRPPKNVKIIAKAEVIESSIDISASEYSLLCTLSDFNLVEDIYNNNEMLDFEITQALVTLRKKEIIKVVKLV